MSAEAVLEVFDRRGQFGLIVLDGQHVVGAPLPDRLSDVGLRAHGIGGYRAAGQRQGGMHLGNRSLFVGLLCRGTLSQHQSSAGGKGLNQMQCGGISPARTAAGLPVDGHHIRVQRGDHAACPLPKCRFELAGIDQPQQASEGVVRGNAVKQAQITAQPILLFLGP